MRIAVIAALALGLGWQSRAQAEPIVRQAAESAAQFREKIRTLLKPAAMAAVQPAGNAAKVLDVGGFFLNANDAAALTAWYRDKLGIPLMVDPSNGHSYCMFQHGTEPGAFTVFAIRPAATPVTERNQATLNLRVDDFDGFVAKLKAAGVVVDKTEDYSYGRFGWTKDAEGNAVEFWQAIAH